MFEELIDGHVIKTMFREHEHILNILDELHNLGEQLSEQNNSKNKNNLLYVNDVLGTYKSKPHGIKALSKYKNWFPIKASPALAGICADLMGDGHLQGPPKWRIDYTSKSIQELNRFENEI